MNKKDTILLSALKLLTEKGIHNTPMSAIAKEAETGMGTIYNYFTTKDELINEIYLTIKNKEKSIFSDFKTNEPIKEQFENYLTSITSFFIENPMYFKFMEQLQASPIITENSRNIGSESVHSTIELLKKGKQDKIIKNIETNELILFVGGAILSYLRFYLNENNPIFFENQKQMIWDAIKI